MNNLFIMHTQYNILLALASIEKDFKGDDNDLIVLAEFPLKDEFIKKIKVFFQNVYVAQAQYDNSNGFFKLFHFFSKYYRCRYVCCKFYDRVITSQDQYFDTLLVSKIMKKNKKIKWFSVEEDAYYSLGISLQPEKKVKKIIKSIYYNYLLSFLFGKNTMYEMQPCYGANHAIERLYLTYPEFVRNELKDKTKAKIEFTDIQFAVKQLYTNNITDRNEMTLKNRSILFLGDLSERYRNYFKIKEIVSFLSDFCKDSNWHLYIKYHPRETNKFSLPFAEKEISPTIPAEALLSENINKQIIVIGNQSTAVFLAKKLGYKTISIARLENPSMIDASTIFYQKIGIICIENINQLKEEIL